MDRDAANSMTARPAIVPAEPIVIGTFADAVAPPDHPENQARYRLRLPRTLEKPAPRPEPRDKAKPTPHQEGLLPPAANDAAEATATPAERDGFKDRFQENLADDTRPYRNIAVLMMECRGKDIQATIDGVLAVCARRQMTPVFVTDHDDFSIFRTRGLFFEYIPAVEERHRFGGGRNWNLYLERRLDLIKEKWSIDGFVSFGSREPGLAGGPVAKTPKIGFWRRQILRAARLAVTPGMRPKMTEAPDALSPIARRVD